MNMELDKRDNSAPSCSGDELIFNDDCRLSGMKRKSVSSTTPECTLGSCRKKMMVACGGKKRKSVSSECTLGTCNKKRISLHKDIISAILAKLPSKTVVRLKLACKSWDKLISDRYLIKLHFQQQLKTKEEQPLGSGILITTQKSFTNRIRFYVTESELSMKFLFESYLPFFAGNNSYSFCSHFQLCEGLLLFELRTRVFVCNPATTELVYVPHISSPNKLDDPVSKKFAVTCGFGFDCFSRRYKIARYFYRWIDVEKQSYSMGLEVFILGWSANWRPVAEDPPCPVSNDAFPASAGGAVYWKVWDELLHSSSRSTILRFDLTDEKFRVIDLPPVRCPMDPSLKVSQGNLFYLVLDTSTQQTCVWMLNKAEKWTPTCMVNALPGPSKMEFVTFQRQNLLFLKERVLYAFNLETKSFSILLDDFKKLDDAELTNDPCSKSARSVFGEKYVSTLMGYAESISPIRIFPPFSLFHLWTLQP